MKSLKFIIILIISVLSYSCSKKSFTAPAELMGAKDIYYNENLNTMSQMYPYWNISFGSFQVVNESIRADLIANASSETLYKAKRLEIVEKSLMLQKLALIRFVLNTPEFEEELMKKKFYSSVNASGPNGNIKRGDLYDNKRLLEVLRRRHYNVTIRKGIISKGAAAVGVLGPSLYVMADDNKSVSNSYWIAFPNHEDWSKGGYLQDSYMAGVVFHEMLHNSGFNHNVPNDATYGIQGVFTKVYGDKIFREKYREQLASFRAFYERKYSNELKSPTIYKSKKISLRTDYINGNNDSDAEICILYHDGTSSIEKY